jgi:hypothetical protein
MFDVVEEILPFGANQWEAAAVHFNVQLPIHFTPRTAESMKTKYNKFKAVQKPTGDPDCPPNVRRAKRIQYAIERAMGVANFQQSSDSEPDDDEQQQISEAEGDFDELGEESDNSAGSRAQPEQQQTGGSVAVGREDYGPQLGGNPMLDALALQTSSSSSSSSSPALPHPTATVIHEHPRVSVQLTAQIRVVDQV